MATKPHSGPGWHDDAVQQPDWDIASLEVTKLVRERVPVKGGGTSTMGELLDSYLTEMVAQGSEVQSVTLTFGEDQWPQYAQGHTARGKI